MQTFELTFNKPAVRAPLFGESNKLPPGIKLRLRNGQLQFKESKRSEGPSILPVKARGRGGFVVEIDGKLADQIMKTVDMENPYLSLVREPGTYGWVVTTPFEKSGTPPKFEPHVRIWKKKRTKGAEKVVASTGRRRRRRVKTANGRRTNANGRRAAVNGKGGAVNAAERARMDRALAAITDSAERMERALEAMTTSAGRTDRAMGALVVAFLRENPEVLVEHPELVPKKRRGRRPSISAGRGLGSRQRAAQKATGRRGRRKQAEVEAPAAPAPKQRRRRATATSEPAAAATAAPKARRTRRASQPVEDAGSVKASVKEKVQKSPPAGISPTEAVDDNMPEEERIAAQARNATRLLGREPHDHDAPKHDAPKHDAPKHDAPKHDAPKHDAPKHDAPKHDAPKHDAPREPKEARREDAGQEHDGENGAKEVEEAQA